VIDDFFLALGTLSRIRAPKINNINFQRSTIYFPVIGYIAAFILYITDNAVNFLFPGHISRIISILIYYLFFGYFHFDGLLDCIDGFFPSHKSVEERLRIMKDSNTGAFALLFGTIFIILEIICVIDSNDYWYIFPVFGRITPIFLLAFSKPATQNGLGQLYFPYPKKYCVPVLLLAVPLIVLSVKLLFWVAASFFLGIVISLYSRKKINGITGDVLGFSIMLSELFFLLYLNTTLF